MSTTKLDEYNNKMTELAEAIKEKNPDAPTTMTVSQMVDAVKMLDTVDSALTAYLNDIAENGRW